MKLSTKHLFLQGIFLLAILSFAKAQPIINWAAHCGGIESDKSLDVSVDQAGNLYTSGYYNNAGFFGSIYLNPGTASKEAFVTRMGPSGGFVWAVSGGGYFDDRTLGLCNDPQGNVIATGTYWSNSTFGPFSLNGSADHVFVVKIDLNGNFLWATTGGSSGDDHGYDLVTDPQGNIFITGYLSNHYGPTPGTATFGTLPSFTVHDSIAFVARLSPTGVWQWVKTFGGTDVEHDNDIAIDSLGNVYVVGGFYGTKSFGPVSLTSTNNSRDIFVVKYDANGNFVWVTTTGDTLDDRANGITIDHEQHIYITGEFRDHVIFGADTLNNYGGPSGRDIFVGRMDLNGNWVWAKRAGSTSGGDAGRAITVNRNGNIFVTGQCRGLVKFGNDTIFHTGSDSIQAFVAAIDSLGDWKWALHCGGPLEDRGYGIVADSACRLYFCGYYDMPNGQFGPHSLTTNGRKDGFMARIDGGCFTYEAPDAIEDEVADECAPRLPSVFSPNGSGCISVLDGWCVESMKCMIFNSWGQTVYQTKDPLFCWDGTSTNGTTLATGMYYYVYEATLESGKNIVSKGKIAVIR
jgi:hypothetical protein